MTRLGPATLEAILAQGRAIAHAIPVTIANWLFGTESLSTRNRTARICIKFYPGAPISLYQNVPHMREQQRVHPETNLQADVSPAVLPGAPAAAFTQLT